MDLNFLEILRVVLLGFILKIYSPDSYGLKSACFLFTNINCAMHAEALK